MRRPVSTAEERSRKVTERPARRVDSRKGKLFERYARFLGSLDRVPVRTVPFTRIDPRTFDHRAAFVLAQVDGVATLETILDVSGMARLDALEILCALGERGLIALRCPTLRPAASTVESGVRPRVPKERG